MSQVISNYAGPEDMIAADAVGARARSAMQAFEVTPSAQPAFEVTSAAQPAVAVRKPETVQPVCWPAGDIDAAPQDLFAEVAIGLDRTRTMLDRLGPQLEQTGLLTALEARTPATCDHMRRVAKSATALARAMGLPEREVREVRSAALFHDIGKITIPSHLLEGPGPLSENEMSVLRLHVVIGAEILSEIPTLAAAAPVVMATHERYDGAGFPWGLAGSDIPLAARIIAVASAHDAMTARRPSGTPLSEAEATRELVRCAGAAFDPEVVQAWLELVGVPAYWSE